MPETAKRRRLCVFALQLGGPKTLADIEPFLRNLFEDVLPVPGLVRGWLARALAKRRAPKVAPLYAELGGGSPILANTEEQARALEQKLSELGYEARVLVTMRYSPPRVADVLDEARRHWSDATWVALPLYPQYSLATTRSSLDELGFELATAEQERLVTITAYPAHEGYLAAMAECVREALAEIPADERSGTHVVFSAHGLPMKLVREGDPYPDHVRQTVQGISARLEGELPTHVSYQSRVGPARWLQPSTVQTVSELGKGGVRALVVVPVSFVSEHIETLQELDVELRHVAEAAGVRTYVRAKTPAARPSFIAALADLIDRAVPEA